MITVPNSFVPCLSSPSWHGVAQLKPGLCAEAAQLGACTLHTHTLGVLGASGAANTSDFQCCRKQSWFGEGIKTEARTSLQQCPLLLLSLMWCWHFHYTLVFSGFITPSKKKMLRAKYWQTVLLAKKWRIYRVQREGGSLRLCLFRWESDSNMNRATPTSSLCLKLCQNVRSHMLNPEAQSIASQSRSTSLESMKKNQNARLLPRLQIRYLLFALDPFWTTKIIL